MTVLISKPAINLRAKLAAPAIIKPWEEYKFYPKGLIENGGFDTATVWLARAGTVKISGGELNLVLGDRVYQPFKTHVDVNILALDESTPSVTTYTGSNTLGDGSLVRWAFDVTSIATNGRLQLYFNANDDVEFKLLGTASDINIDNFSVFETDGVDVIHTLKSGWYPKDVYEDGLLLREGAEHDYTVHTDGFKWWIKPAVTPSSLTETCIVGVRA